MISKDSLSELENTLAVQGVTNTNLMRLFGEIMGTPVTAADRDDRQALLQVLREALGHLEDAWNEIELAIELVRREIENGMD